MEDTLMRLMHHLFYSIPKLHPIIRPFFYSQTKSSSPALNCKRYMTLMTKISPRLVIADWDETLTEKDTISVLAQAPSTSIKPFTHYGDIYGDAYTSYTKQFGPCKTLEDHIAFQKGMRPIEMSSIDALEADRYFAGISKSDIEQAAEKVKLRPGAVEFLKHCQSAKLKVVILSVNWSRIFIDATLRRYGIPVADGFESTKSQWNVKIIANEFEFHKGITTGIWQTPDIRTSEDKLRYVEELKQSLTSSVLDKLHIHMQVQATINNENLEDADNADALGIEGGSENVMYIGDSATDLFPLVAVSYPVAMQGSKIDKLLDDFGVEHYSGSWDDIESLIDWKAID